MRDSIFKILSVFMACLFTISAVYAAEDRISEGTIIFDSNNSRNIKGFRSNYEDNTEGIFSDNEFPIRISYRIDTDRGSGEVVFSDASSNLELRIVGLPGAFKIVDTESFNNPLPKEIENKLSKAIRADDSTKLFVLSAMDHNGNLISKDHPILNDPVDYVDLFFEPESVYAVEAKPGSGGFCWRVGPIEYHRWYD